MPIATAAQVQDLAQQYFDSRYATFVGWGKTDEHMAQRWADIADLLLSTVIPLSTTAAPARAAFLGIVIAAMGQPGFEENLQTAFMQYSTILAGGMLPLFTGTPPPAPPPFVFNGMVTKSAAIEMANMAAILFIWAKTGTATPVPSGSPITWS